MSLPANLYTEVAKIGYGRFSSVYLARSLGSGEIRCVKRVNGPLGEPEYKILAQLDHPNIVRVFSGLSIPHGCYLIEMELHDESVYDFLSRTSYRIQEPSVRALALQIAMGIQHCHSKGFIHGDIKPGNILISKKDGLIKLCDFGLSRPISQTQDPTGTRWYKPIELLYGEEKPSIGVDIWSFGCVVAELYTSKPLFPGTTDIHQLYLIQSVLGPVIEEEWPGVVNLKDHGKVAFDIPSPTGIRAELCTENIAERMLQMIEGCLVYDPLRRMNSEECIVSTDMKDDESVAILKQLLLCLER